MSPLVMVYHRFFGFFRMFKNIIRKNMLSSFNPVKAVNLSFGSLLLFISLYDIPSV